MEVPLYDMTPSENHFGATSPHVFVKRFGKLSLNYPYYSFLSGALLNLN